MRSIGLIAILFFYMCACSQQKGETTGVRQGIKEAKKNSSSDKTKNIQENESGESTEKDEEKSEEEETSNSVKKVDPHSLFVIKLRVATFRNKKLINELISYDVDGRADYVYYKICPLEVTNQKCDKGETCDTGGECIENIYTLNRLVLPVMKAGQVAISVRACVEKDRSLDRSESCGKWEEIIYNSHRYDEEAERLLLEKERIMTQLDRLETDFRFALEEFRNDSYECIKNDASVQKHLESKIKFVELILKAPVGWMTESVKMQAGNLLGAVGLEEEFEALGSTLTDFKDEVSEFLGDQCEKMGEQYCGYLRQMGEMGKMFLQAFNPVHSVGVLSNAIHDLTADPDDLVKRNCHAEQIFQQRQEAIERYWVNSAERLNQIKASLQEKGYL